MRSAVRRRSRRGEQVSEGRSLPAPIEGWDRSSPIQAMSERRARVLDNWFPTPTDIRLRRGFQIHASGMGSGVVDSLMTYHGVTEAASKMFAATGGTVYDVTSRAAATATPLTSMGGNRFQFVNFTTSGGKFLVVCNGVDTVRHYNGSTWAAPSLSITTYSSENIINIAAHKNRLWVVFKDSTVAGYLGTGAVAGTVTNFDFGGLFTKGGHLVAIGTLSRDSGAGEDDLLVAISSRGQVAVYAGTDPSSASTWALIGVYDIAPPIGNRPFAKAGGDLAVITIQGVLPLSIAVQRDRAGTADIEMTARIRNAFNEVARDYKGNFGWEICSYPLGGYILVNIPLQEGSVQHQYVMNSENGAWCRFTGQNANCWTIFKENIYFGGNDGLVYQADQTALDVLTTITAEGKGAYNYFKAPGMNKDFKLLRSIITTDADLRPALGISTDFKDNVTLGTPIVSEQAAAVFDSALFDVDVFPVENRTVGDWASVSGDGYCGSIHFRAQSASPDAYSVWGVSDWGQAPWSGTIGDVDLQLNSFDIVYEKGLVL